jgi:SPFH domain/Band 7 family protein
MTMPGSSSEGRWQDLKRMNRFLLPIIGLIFLATIYTIIYVSINLESWASQGSARFLFWLYILRIIVVISSPLIAVLIGLLFIFRQSNLFIRSFYQPKEDEKLGPLIQRKLLGVPPLPPPLHSIFKYPFIVIRKPQLDDTHWARWFGGPATLVIHEGNAVYLERGNAFSRVVGPGLPMAFLDRYERIKEVVDLRSQTKIGEIMPWTKDGIRIKLTIRTECQINASPEALVQSSKKFRFPFDPLAVKTAVEHMSVRINPKGELYAASWLEGAWGTITGSINAYVAGHSLDELFIAPQANGNMNSEPSENHFPNDIAQILSHKIIEEALEKIKSGLAQNGVRVLSIQITKVEMPKEVLELRAKYWESIKKRIEAQRNSRAEANRIRIREQAHAEAQRTMLNAITQKLERVDPDNLTEPLILSLSGLIDQGLEDPLVRPLIAKETIAVLNRVRKMLAEGF